jgi:hypothetical protein
MSGGSKFSSEVPKGDAWGVENAVAEAAAEFEATGHSPMIPCIAVIGIKEVQLRSGDDGPTRVAVVNIRRIEALTTDSAIRTGQKLVMKAMENRRGPDTMLPFDEAEMITQAFGGVDVATLEREEQDARELAEDKAMDDPQRLRRHLVAVHNHTADEIEGMEWADVRTLHDSDHERDPADGLVPHDKDWWEWRRASLEAAEADADAENTADPDDGPATEIEDGEDEEEDDLPTHMVDNLPDDDAPAVPGVEFSGDDKNSTED